MIRPGCTPDIWTSSRRFGSEMSSKTLPKLGLGERRQSSAEDNTIGTVGWHLTSQSASIKQRSKACCPRGIRHKIPHHKSKKRAQTDLRSPSRSMGEIKT
jgi:hypothetical protein